MPTVLVRLVCLAALVCAGCVGTYDPESRSRYSLETRAGETGRATPSRGGLRILGRRNTPPPPPDRFAEQSPAGQVTIPTTPSGKQLGWLMTAFNGADIRRFDDNCSETFLRKTPPNDLRAVISQWRRDEFCDGPADVHALETASLGTISAIVRGRATNRYSRVQLSTDKFGKINSLTLASLLDYRPGNLSGWTAVDARLDELAPRAALAAYEVTDAAARPIHQHRSDAMLSIGGLSTFYIAGTLAETVASGRARWDQPIKVSDDFKSLMGGRLQLEPEETEFPMSQYLSLMLGGGGWNGWGDTSAFDHLLREAGRDHVEEFMSRCNADPGRNKPFLSTMEYFRIKLGSDRSLPARFAGANESDKRSLLLPGSASDRSAPSLSVVANWRLPYEVDRIGWFATADDVSRLVFALVRASRGKGMEPLANALRLSDALTESGSPAWMSAGIKSGSEPGVLSMVWVLQRADGKWFILVLIANDPVRPLRHTELAEVAAAAVKLLADPKK